MSTKENDQRGFALLTVIFFVLALTILGLSLFSLSNYEAGFYRPAVQRAEAMQAARGAMDWARFVIESRDNLDNVSHPASRPPLVQYAVARYGGIDSPDSSSLLFGDPSHTSPYAPVWMKVMAGSGDQQQAVVAQFQPIKGADIYKRLITATDFVWVNQNQFSNGTPGGVGLREIDQLFLYGEIATPVIRDENSQDPSAQIKSAWCQKPIPAGFPLPETDLSDASAWWQSHLSAANVENGAGTAITLSSGSQPALYRATGHEPGSGRYWSVFGSLTTITVTGTCVWMLPEGFRSDKQVAINSGGGQATLILVARPDGTPNVAESNVGWAFLGGIVIDPNVRVFIVSAGGIELEQVNDGQHASAGSPTQSFLSLYGHWVHIQAPIDNGHSASYWHGTSCVNRAPEDATGDLVDKLVEKDLLPNSRFCRNRLALTAGSWQEAAMGSGN